MLKKKREREKRLTDKARAKDDENKKKTNVVEDTCNAQTKIENDDAKDATTKKRQKVQARSKKKMNVYHKTRHWLMKPT